jgi:hypothetical protein
MGFVITQPILREAAIVAKLWEGAKPITPDELKNEYRISKEGVRSRGQRAGELALELVEHMTRAMGFVITQPILHWHKGNPDFLVSI